MLKNVPKQCLLIAATLMVMAAGCGSSTEDNPNPVITVTPTPTPTVSPDYHLEFHSQITASSERSNAFTAVTVADGYKSAQNGDPTGYIWKPASSNYNSAYIELEWNSQVVITSLQIFDNPQVGQQVKGGLVTYENSKDANMNFTPSNFAELPDDGKTGLMVSGSGSPVTKVRIGITSHVGTEAGIAEIYVMGHRVDEKIGEGNIALFGHISEQQQTGYSSIKAPALSYRPMFVKDGVKAGSVDAGISWVSDGNGGNAYIVMEFDRPYAIQKVILYDRVETNVARITEGAVRFTDAGMKVDFSKAGSDASVEVVPSSSVKSSKIRIDITSVEGPNNDTGLAEIEVIGSYAP